MSVLELDSHWTVYCIVPICCAYRHSVGTVSKAGYNILCFICLLAAKRSHTERYHSNGEGLDGTKKGAENPNSYSR